MKNKKPVIIIGNGGHASVLTEILLLTNRKIIGFTALQKENNQFGLSYLGSDEIIKEYNSNEIELVLGIGSVSVSNIRKKLFNHFKGIDYTFSSVIHPTSIISKFATINEGVQILAGSIIQSFSTISSNCIINTASIIEHDCFIDSHVHISPRSVLSGQVRVGFETHIGTGSTVIQGISIGNNVLIGSGSVVIKDISDGQRVSGVPAKEM